MLASSSALDFVHMVLGPPAAIAYSVGSDASGAVYSVGCVSSASDFKITPGALSASSFFGPAIFLQKLSPDGSKVLVSALLAGVQSCLFSIAAKTDSAGNTYVALLYSSVAQMNITWGGEPDGGTAVLKISPQGDRILSGERVLGYQGPPWALDVDSSGSVYVAAVGIQQIQVGKIGADGSVVEYSIPFTDPYDRGIGLAAGPDHSIYVAASPSYIYRIDPSLSTVIYRTQIGSQYRGQSLGRIAVDAAGNAYVAGSLPFPDGAAPIPVNQVGFTQAAPGTNHAVIVKLDPAGAIVYATAFDATAFTAVALDKNGGVWAAGASQIGFTIAAVDPAGTALTHYISLPAIRPQVYNGGENQVYGAMLDANGRLLVAGMTPSLTLPDAAAGRDYGVNDAGDANAFVLRVNPAAPQADLQIATTASATITCWFCHITYTVQLKNSGPAPATDVLLKFPDFVNGNPVFTELMVSCRATQSGFCSKNGNIQRIVFPVLAPGETEYVEFEVTVPLQAPNPFPLLLSALTSTEDPNQSNNETVIDTPVQTVFLQTGAPGAFQVQVDDRMVISAALPPEFAGPPVAANTDIEVYVPTPQAVSGILYAFDGWSDGSGDNPRVFHVGSSGLQLPMKVRRVTEPWVSPDAPVVQAGSYQTGAVSPGEIVTLFGYNLGPSVLQSASLDSSGRIATSLAGLQVFFGDAPAPIVYASANTSAVIVPYSVSGESTVVLSIQYNQLVSAPLVVKVTDSAPGLFTQNSQGSGPLAAFNSDGSTNSLAQPAARGDIVVFYGSGEGLTQPVPPDGTIAGPAPPMPLLPVSVTIGGKPAQVVYSGGVPGLTAGLIQINARVPPDASPGLLPAILTVGKAASQREATVAVR
ncbi:MAG TPA: hypothetical protein VH639_08505 [Bryobacteraceae bacterium]|jgi:uncharacterized protein (TIGR03437 family)